MRNRGTKVKKSGTEKKSEKKYTLKTKYVLFQMQVNIFTLAHPERSV